MTDARAKRITVLTAAAKAKSEAKTRAAEQAIRALVKRGEPITFQAVQREAGVSHAFLYGHPDLRSRIEHLRARTRPTRHHPTTAGLRQHAGPRADRPDRRTQETAPPRLQNLRDALEKAHGENLDLRRELARRGRCPSHPATHVASIATTT